MEVDTQVFGDPAGVRSLGEWMTRTSSAVHDGGSVLHRVRGESEATWKGPAGAAFREHIGRGGQDADDLTESVESAGGAMVDFAGDLDTAIATMTQARGVAAEAGLIVTATGIQEPGPAPVAPMTTGGSVDAIRSHADAVSAHDRKVAAWTEVQSTVGQARETERGAHETLARRIREHGTLWSNVKQNKFFITADALSGTAGSLYNAQNKWNMKAPQLRAVATQAQNLLNSSMSQAGRDRALQIMLQRSAAADDAARAAASNARFLGPLNSPHVSRGMRFLGSSVKGVPVVGTIITAGQIGSDIHSGKDVDRSIASGVAGLAAGTLATNATLLAVGAAGGPVTLGAVAVGVGASMVVGWAVDEYWDDIEDSSVGQAVGGAVEGTKDFFGKVF